MYLGLDLGTGSAKALLLDANGATVGETSAAYHAVSPHAGWSEIDPEIWLQALTTCVQALPAGARAAVKGIGLSGQMHGVVLSDAQGNALRPAVLWLDTRAVAQLARYPTLADSLKRLGNAPSAGMAGPILLWLAEHEPIGLQAARWALQPKDWLRLRLTGIAGSEASDASGTLLADRQGRWDRSLLETLGLPDRLLAPHFASHEAAGTLTASLAAAWGLPAGIPVAAGGGDTPVAALGSGLLLDGSAQLTTGSGAQIVVIRNALPAPSAKLNCYRTAAPPELPRWYTMAAMQNAGVALEWARRTLGLDWPAAYAAAFGSSLRTDDELFFLPYLGGERTPWMDAQVRGAWVGLSPGTDNGALMRAAFEGVAFAIRAGLDALHAQGTRPTQLRLAGGGSVHRAWQQLLMDVLQLPLEAVDCPNASARGAALLGGLAAGHWSTADLYALAPACRPVGEPASVRYALPYRRFCDLYARLAGWFGRDGLQTEN